ncbi:MAG: hypothetical protein Q9162_004109 [Coniocarpon cinnabarinum]
MLRWGFLLTGPATAILLLALSIFMALSFWELQRYMECLYLMLQLGYYEDPTQRAVRDAIADGTYQIHLEQEYVHFFFPHLHKQPLPPRSVYHEVNLILFARECLFNALMTILNNPEFLTRRHERMNYPGSAVTREMTRIFEED